jgi:Zn-dependent protease with chaperone function
MSSTAELPTGPSLKGRIAAAIALTVVFYALALTIGVGLVALPVIMVLSGYFNLWVTVGGLFLGGSILVAIVPRRNTFHPPGLKLTEADAPGLMAMIRDEAAAVQEKAPDDVYLTMEVNAAVTQASGGRRVLIVGLPLLQMLSERELRGVIAHEFGHYRGGDLKAGPLIFRTRQAIVRTVDHLTDEDGDEWWAQRAVRAPFIWYGRTFMRITAAISRREEFAADRCAVARVGRDAHVTALRSIGANAAAYDSFWSAEVVPVLQAGRRPPVGEGFARFMADKGVRDATDAYLNDVLKTDTDPYDSHPSLAERIAAVEALPAGEPDDDTPALGLAADAETLEQRVLRELIGDEFPAVGWDEIGVEVYVARARELVSEFPAVIAGVTAGSLADAVARIPATAREISGPDDDPEFVRDLVATVLADGLLLALHGAGWTVTAPPAEPVVARRENNQGLVPHVAVDEIRTKRLSAEQWSANLRELGIDELPLGEPAAAPVAH